MLTLLVLLGCRESMGPRVEVSEGRSASDAYAGLLAEVVTYDGYVDYELLEKKRGPLDDYVAWMANSRAWRLERPVDRVDEFLNAYNALVLYQVLERGRPSSVLDVKGWIPVPGAKFFAGTQFKLGREWVSLSEIEHERVRQTSLDYRVHAAMNCGARSCPPLRRDLYSRKGLNLQLREQMARWINDDRGLWFDGDTVVFNPIFDWYARDFAFWSAGENLCEIASHFAMSEREGRLKSASKAGCPHRFFDYDWSLNHAAVLAE